jgi:hypothetical protein
MRAHWFVALAGIALTASAAQARSFNFSQISVRGSQAVDAWGINDKGAITGSFTGAQGVRPFVLASEAVTLLPKMHFKTELGPVSGYPTPTSINAFGEVAGIGLFDADEFTYRSFLFRNGRYEHRFMQALSDNFPYDSDGVGINNHRSIYFTYLSDADVRAEVFTPHNDYWPSGCLNQNYIASLNNAGTAAGTCIGFNGPSLVFTEALSSSPATLIQPPGAQNNYGGLINDANQVAGTFVDAINAWHGFLYQAGAYTVFDMPVASVQLTVQAINNSGHVVGEYFNPSSNL